MNTKTIAHLADLHFDVDHLEDALTCFTAAITAAVERRCDAMILAGDIWDREIRVDERSPLMPVVRLIRDVADHMPVIIVKGNHDRPGSLGIFEQLDALKMIRVFETPGQVLLGGIVFSCLPYPNKAFLLAQANGSQDETDVKANNALRGIIAGFAAGRQGYFGQANAVSENAPHILVYHGNVTGGAVESGQILLGGDVMIGAADLEASGADYVALGHLHAWQKLGTRCYYPGSLYHCNFGETESKYMNIVRVSRGAHEVEKVRLPSRPRVTVDVTPDSLRESAPMDDYEDMHLRVRVRMTEEEAASFDEQLAANTYRGIASLKVEKIITPRERIRCEQITEAQQLRDKVLAWGESVGEQITDDVLEFADVLETEVQHG
jgi:exonuclease SbcD